MMSKDIEFSAYQTSESKHPIKTSFLQEMESIKNGDYETQVMKARQLRAFETEAAYKKYRTENVFCFTAGVNSTKPGKGNPSPEEYTGLLTLDIDDKSQDHKQNKEILKKFPWVMCAGHSIGGIGLFAIIKCDRKRLKESHDSAVHILSAEGVKVAGAQENVNRLRYASWDPDIYYVEDPAFAPVVPITISKSQPATLISPANTLVLVEGVNDKPHIFESIVRIKSAGVKLWPAGERHGYLVKIITWCNALGMSEEFVLEMAEKHCRPMMENGNNYDIESKVSDLYRRYKNEHGTKEWKDAGNTMVPAEQVLPAFTLADLEKYRVTKEKVIPRTQAMITIGNARVAAAGNITSVTAEGKMGKTAFSSVLLAGAISKTGDIEGFPDVNVIPNPDGKAVMHFDTEQSEEDQQHNINTVLKRGGNTETPPN